jgi:hypothetical protein
MPAWPPERVIDSIRKLEGLRQSRVFALIQGGDDHISPVTMRSVCSAVRGMRKQRVPTIDLLLQSGGGHAEVAYSIVNLLRRHCERLNVIVPRYAKSAATLMCLGADAIFMGEFAELGPLDVQIMDPFERGTAPFSPLDEFKSMEFLKEYATELLDYFAMLLLERSGMSVKEVLHESIPALVGLMTPMYSRIDPSKVGGYRRALAIGEEYAKRLLKRRRFPKADQLAQKLVWSYPAHNFVIDATELRELGLPVSTIPPAEEAILQELMDGIGHAHSAYGFTEQPPTAKPKARKQTKPKVRAAKPDLQAV